jgi:hypothetical protein
MHEVIEKELSLFSKLLFTEGILTFDEEFRTKLRPLEKGKLGVIV